MRADDYERKINYDWPNHKSSNTAHDDKYDWLSVKQYKQMLVNHLQLIFFVYKTQSPFLQSLK